MHKVIRAVCCAGLAGVTISGLLCSPAHALSKKALVKYNQCVKDIVEETTFRLEPGSLKKKPASEEERGKRMRELMPLMYGVGESKWRGTLSFWVDFFKKAAARLSKEKITREPELVAWNKKLIAGYRDSQSVTELALSLMKTPDHQGLQEALANKDLSTKIQDNAVYHDKLKNELKDLIRTSLPGDDEAIRMADELAGPYVETSWK